jgi:glyoxylase-like metal-dependent hydrolase (beta-lactamase superfamily II)
VYDNITRAVASVTDKPITAAVYPHYHADHIGDIGKYVEAARQQRIELRIIASSKTQQSMDLAVGRRYFLGAAGVGLDAGLIAYFVRAGDRRPFPVRALRAALRFVRMLGMPRLLIEADGRAWHTDSPMVSFDLRAHAAGGT